jgi:hypothetical protein
VDLGQTERIDLFGLSRPDILRYLPPTFVVPKAAGRDWDRLRADSGSKTETAFKKWLRDNLGLIDDDSGLMDAISQLDEVPEDFLGLVAKATQIARDPWWRHSLA